MIYHACERCGKSKQPSKQPLCYTCRTDLRTKSLCQRCKRLAPIHRRIGEAVYCKTCSIYFRPLQPCQLCHRMTRLVAHGLCGACYDRWRRQRGSLYTVNEYESYLFKASRTSVHLTIKLGELMAKKKRPHSHIEMIAHDGGCFCCSNRPQHQRLVEGVRVDLCPQHYYNMTFGDLVTRMRRLKGETSEISAATGSDTPQQ